MGTSQAFRPQGSELPCFRCGSATPSEDLDRLLWCEGCVARARKRALRIGLAAGGTLVLLLGLYIGLVIRPDLSLIPAGWAATLVVAFYLGGRVARELAYGVMRWQNRAGAETRGAGADGAGLPSHPSSTQF
jgi:hypothetical protein